MMMAQHRSTNSSTNGTSTARVPLRRWIEDEAKKQISARHNTIDSHTEKQRQKDKTILRKTTIAYGIAELFRRHGATTRRARSSSAEPSAAAPSQSQSLSLSESCGIENFVVRVSKPDKNNRNGHSRPLSSWKRNDIKGVEMIAPQLSASIVEPSFLRSSLDDISDASDCDDQENNHGGKYLEVEISPELDAANVVGTASLLVEQELARCHLLGVLLYELYSHLSPLPAEGFSGMRFSNEERESKRENSNEPAQKRKKISSGSNSVVAEITSSSEAASGNGVSPGPEITHSALQHSPYVPLIDLGFPPSICLLVQNLIECGGANPPEDAYDSLKTASKDLHLLLLDPSRFLFNNEIGSENNRGGSGSGNGHGNGNGSGGTQTQHLLFRKHRLYGRENEVTSITDAFCRVSGGKSEAFFIGGFSGSGKSMLVNSLTARVDMAEGYVLTHKFDQMSKERPLLEVIAVFNNLCLLIKKRSSQWHLLAIVKNLTDVFGTDLTVLARLLPNIEALSPQLKQTDDEKRESGHQMNLRSVCFTLQRFMRVVSSKAHPVMLFLDDLQWCDNSALTLIEGVLCDVCGSSCLFFVGSYRNNEVRDDHAIFSLMDSLKTCCVPTTTLTLEGLSMEDLNTMISDAMCMFPRICKPLSDIVFQKTKGNPFFVLEFLKSLVDGALLQYSPSRRRWVWDKDRIRSMDITGNVLYLLSSKMSGLSENIQLALKVAACFGITIKESVVGYLGSNSEYAHIRDGLELVVSEGFMIQLSSSDFNFVHDKVREAAYSLIPDIEKKQYHYSLGMALYSTTKGSNVDDIIFSLADQINHGIDHSSVQSPELRIELAELNEKAGVKAVKCSDYSTARSYLNTALSLLPADHWKSHYDKSRRLAFLLAKSAYSCGDMEKAQSILQEILEECRCIEDKLPAYFLLVMILNNCGAGLEAYTTCQEVLSQLDETIPHSSDPKQTKKMIESTAKIVQNVVDADLLEMKEMDKKFSITLKFYVLMTTVAFFAKPKMFAFLACRSVQLTMKHGICNYSIMGFVQYAAMLGANTTTKDVPAASRIGKAAMSCLKKRFNSSEQLANIYFCYYGFVAFHTEPLQSCAAMMRQGFDAGMSIGDCGTAFFNAIQHIKTSLIAGEKLPTLLEKADYYLDLADKYKNELTKSYLLIYRDTISILIDKGESTSSKIKSSANELQLANTSETMQFHRALQAYWLGHSERCHHYIGKVLQMSSITGKISSVMIMFIHGLNSFQVLKRQNTAKLRTIPKNAISTLKAATSHSRWNFRNKVHLLEAENFSFHGNHEEAKASYAAAITSARCSRFIHEQGLACELAGNHYKKMGDLRSAWSFYNQAKQCYAEWGSQMKVDSITRQLETFQISLAATAGKVMS